MWGKNFSILPVPVFVEFEYSVIYSKMFFQQEITDAKVSTLFVGRLLTTGTASDICLCFATKPAQLLQQVSSSKVKYMHEVKESYLL